MSLKCGNALNVVGHIFTQVVQIVQHVAHVNLTRKVVEMTYNWAICVYCKHRGKKKPCCCDKCVNPNPTEFERKED